jgi:anti-sigma B factor antagonist
MSKVTRQSDVTVVQLGPNYDSLNDEALAEFGEALLAEATHAEPPRLVVDLSPTDYIGSSFLELLVRAWKRIKERDGVMALCGVRPFCAEVLQVTRLSTLWAVHATPEEAVAALTQGGKQGAEEGDEAAAG